MPAVTVEDITTLPRIPAPAEGSRPRTLLGVSTAPSGYEGEGFPVRRAFAGVDLARLDPFVHMDQMGEVEYAPGEPKGTPWHPHRGFETVTYMIDGTFEHQDSNGGGGTITNGDTQWMTAGGGVLHIEKPPETLVVSGGLFHGIQLWVNLPHAQKWAQPRYQDLRGDQVALLASDDGGALVRRHRGRPGRARRARLDLHADDDAARHARARRAPGPAVAAGLQRPGLRPRRQRDRRAGRPAGRAPASSRSSVPATRSPLARNRTRKSRSPRWTCIVLGGQPIREPVAWGGPFVMNTREEVLQAFEDFQRGKLGSIPAVHGAPDRAGHRLT